MNSNAQYTLYGSELSYYSGKMRSYLIHKKTTFNEAVPSLLQYSFVFPKRVGAAVVPVVKTPEGEWWADSSVIIDKLETRFSKQSVSPATPVVRFLSYLLELWGDEFWQPATRCNSWYPETRRQKFLHDLGPDMMPGWPAFMQGLVGKDFAKKMQTTQQVLGFQPEQVEVLNAFMRTQLDGLDIHFSQNLFLLGSLPSLGDYGLVGALYAHVGRAEDSRAQWLSSRKHLSDWLDRMFAPIEAGNFVSDEAIPPTLMPAIHSMFDEMLPFLLECREKVIAVPPLTGPRWLDDVTYPMAGTTHTRAASSYVLWMVQRMMDVLANETAEDQERVKAWINANGGETLLTTAWPQMQRQGLSAVRAA